MHWDAMQFLRQCHLFWLWRSIHGVRESAQSVSVGNALLPVGAPSMLCWGHSALIGQQLSASHVLLQLSNLCQAFSKKFKVLNSRAFSLLPCSISWNTEIKASTIVTTKVFWIPHPSVKDQCQAKNIDIK